MVPFSIIIAGALIAGAIYMSGRPATPSVASAGNTAATADSVGTVAPVTAGEHILGDPKTAKLTIIEYSDLECPFCKVFHNSLHQIMDKYQGQVAWVFRNFPIAQLHSKAPKEAEAAECAADIGGNDAYWKYIDEVFAKTGSNNSLDPAQLPIIAQDIGLDVTRFNSCLNSGKFTNKVAADVAAAEKTGARGTPYSVIVSQDGKKTPINGAQPLASVEATIDGLLK